MPGASRVATAWKTARERRATIGSDGSTATNIVQDPVAQVGNTAVPMCCGQVGQPPPSAAPPAKIPA
jgi:hypothetical protein